MQTLVSLSDTSNPTKIFMVAPLGKRPRYTLPLQAEPPRLVHVMEFLAPLSGDLQAYGRQIPARSRRGIGVAGRLPPRGRVTYQPARQRRPRARPIIRILCRSAQGSITSAPLSDRANAAAGSSAYVVATLASTCLGKLAQALLPRHSDFDRLSVPGLSSGNAERSSRVHFPGWRR
jgi:hypothetical protein